MFCEVHMAWNDATKQCMSLKENTGSGWVKFSNKLNKFYNRNTNSKAVTIRLNGIDRAFVPSEDDEEFD